MGERKALVVGINDYPTCPLQGCCNDSEAMKDLLTNHENGDPNFAVWKKDNVSTKGELRGLIETCFEGDADIALFYYSGHGHIDAVGGYLVTPDFSKNDYGVSLQEILTIANKSKCKERIIILDSCYSGFMGSINTDGQNTANINEGVTILTASRSSQTSMEVNGHGVFTSLLIEALNGGAADVTGHISIAGVYAFIDKALGPWAQRPVFKTNVTRFTSLREVQPQVDINILRKIGKYFQNEDFQYELDPSFEPTNKIEIVHNVIEPYAKDENTEILVTKGALLYLPIRQVMCALILFRELRDKSRSRLGLAQTRSAIHIVASRYFLFFLPRPFPLADLKAVEYRSTISIKVLNS